jgi:hypothetical protein
MMSIDTATPQDWNKVTAKYVDPYDMPPKEDLVNRPAHYNSGNIECITAIEESMSSHAFKGYLKGNCLKYLWRYDYKGKQVEDLKKAAWYLNRLTVMVTKENDHAVY